METSPPASAAEADTSARITGRMLRYLREYAVLQAQWGAENSSPSDPWGGLMYLETAQDIQKFLASGTCSYCHGEGCKHCNNNKTRRFVADLLEHAGQAVIVDLLTGSTMTVNYGRGVAPLEYANNICDALNEGKGITK